jgi:hypothetical protein
LRVSRRGFLRLWPRSRGAFGAMRRTCEATQRPPSCRFPLRLE